MSYCATCNQNLSENEGWEHYRRNHKVATRLSTEQRQARINEWRALAAKAKATSQAGAITLFTQLADELEKKVTNQ